MATGIDSIKLADDHAEGWLKKEPGRGLFPGKARRRYFILKERSMVYYSEEPEKKTPEEVRTGKAYTGKGVAKGSIDVSGYELVQNTGESPFTFHLQPAANSQAAKKGRTYVLTADNQSCLSMWTGVLQFLCRDNFETEVL